MDFNSSSLKNYCINDNIIFINNVYLAGKIVWFQKIILTKVLHSIVLMIENSNNYINAYNKMTQIHVFLLTGSCQIYTLYKHTKQKDRKHCFLLLSVMIIFCMILILPVRVWFSLTFIKVMSIKVLKIICRHVFFINNNMKILSYKVSLLQHMFILT